MSHNAMSLNRRRSRWRWGLVLVAAGMVGLVGCSAAGAGASAQSASPSPALAAPEDKRATAAEVAAGLHTIDQIAKDIAAAGADKAKATALDDQIEPVWKQIEGTVKANDENAYLAMEEAFAKLETAARDGDAAASAKGSAAVSQAVQGYLAKYAG